MSAPNSADELAAPLDGLLIDAALGPMRRFRPDSPTLSVAAGLARQPERTVRRLCSLEAEIGRIVVGVSKVEPSKRDRRFADTGWSESPVLYRILQWRPDER